MMVQMNAARRSAATGRPDTPLQAPLRMDHSGVMENTNAASAICDLVSKARMLASAKMIELLRNSMRSRREVATGGASFSTTRAAAGSLDMTGARATPARAARRE